MTYVPGKNDNINISDIIQKLPTREAFLAATCMQVYEVNDYSSCLKKLKWDRPDRFFAPIQNNMYKLVCILTTHSDDVIQKWCDV